MKQLVMLEMKKFKMNTIMKYGMITCGGLIAYLLVFGVIFKQLPSEGIAFFNKVIACNKIVFTVFIAVLIHTMFSEEIYSKSLSISFTYPISRTKLLFAKIVLIVLIGLPFMCASTVVDVLLLGICNMAFHLTVDSVSIGALVILIFTGIVQCILATMAAFIPLFVDVKFASTQATIVTAAVVSVFLYTAVSNSIFGLGWIIFIVAAGLGVYLGKKSLDIVVEKDIM